MQGRYGEYFMIFLPDIIIKRNDISTCQRYGTKSYRRAGRYHRIKVVFKNGRKKMIDCPTRISADAVMRWWKR